MTNETVTNNSTSMLDTVTEPVTEVHEACYVHSLQCAAFILGDQWCS